MSMKFVKFSHVLDFQKKSKMKAGEGLTSGTFPFFTSSSTLSKYIELAQFRSPSIIFGTGGSASVHVCDQPFSVSTDCLVAQIKTELSRKFVIKFIYYYLFKNIWILENGFKGAGLRHISKSYINDISIPELPLEDQKRIVKILDESNALCRKRKQAITLLDDYLQSVFLQISQKNKQTVKLKFLIKDTKGSARSGPFGSDLKHSEFVHSGVAVLGIDNAVKNKFEWKERRFITDQKYEKLKRYTIFPRDVIITIMGTVGRSAVIPSDIPLSINTKHLAALTLDESKANPYFISHAIHSDPRIKRQIIGNSRGAIMSGLNLGIIKNLELPELGVKDQNHFEKIYLKIGSLKQKMLIQSEELETQFQALMQKAFKGEL